MSALFRSSHRGCSSGSISRRSLLGCTAAGLAGSALVPWLVPGVASGAAPATRPAGLIAPPLPPLMPLNRFPRMVQEYFVHRLREAESASEKVRNALATKADAEKYVADVRRKILESFGPFPEKTDLKPRITGIVERDAYKIEKVIFESRPEFLVTANLYIPKGRKFPLPGVVGVCGHSTGGKTEAAYQSFAQGLARQGYVVLIFDPISQGERLQYPDDKLKSTVGVGVGEHLLEGNQQFLVGEFLGSWRAWDGIRALDYLLTRPEVDPAHVGITGNSGGGTMTTWLCGVERRWTMAAPSCFVTTFRRNMENELPADTEQCPPRAIGLCLDHCDFLAAMAPRPVIILSQEKDYFDCRGATEAYLRLKKLYKLLGAEENIGLFIGPRPHGYSVENREAMYRWFNRCTKISDAKEEPKLELEKDETLWCTPRGQVCELKSRTVVSFTRDLSKRFAASRKPLEGEALAAALTSVLKLPARKESPDYRILRPVTARRHPKKACTTYAVETEPGIQALVYMPTDAPHYSRPPQGIERGVLYVSHQSADAELREEPLVADLLKEEASSAFYAIDLRGIGDSRPDTCGKNTFLEPYGCDYFYAIHALMLDHPYAGQRTHDLLRVLDWMAADGHKQIHLAARGWGAIPAAFAAVLHPAVAQVTLKNALTSYADIAESEKYKWPLSSFVPGVLKQFDLPDCYRALAGKKLRQIEPWGADRK